MHNTYSNEFMRANTNINDDAENEYNHSIVDTKQFATENNTNSYGVSVSNKLLDASFDFNITKDSKTLVDRLFLFPAERIDEMIINEKFETEQDFWQFVDKVSSKSHEDFRFVIDNGINDEPFCNAPSYIKKLEDARSNSTDNNELLENLLSLSKKLNEAWKDIYVVQNKIKQGYYSTMLKVDNPFIIPGDRFRECYYWDTYWILEGLLNNGMNKTAIGMVENFIGLIRKHGYIPNGLRSYYLNRTQPPYFPMMLFALYRNIAWDDIKHIMIAGLEAAIEEHSFFMANRSTEIDVDGKHLLNIYKVSSSTPRPESYREDKQLTQENNREDRGTRRTESETYTDIKSASESGWDFSSRWLKDKSDPASIRTSKRIPVDLNAIMYANELIISKLFEITQGTDSSEAARFKEMSTRRLKAINSVLWNSEEGVWNDYDIEDKMHTSTGFYASNLIPMCYGINPPADADTTVYDILDKFAHEIFGNEGGMPVSGPAYKNSPLQWDYPNVWPPLVHIMTFFLERIDEREMALHMARALLRNISISTSFQDERKRGIFEKYDCTRVGEPGGKGEYTLQRGFGWTNGAAIHFIEHFSSEIVSTKPHAESYKSILSIIKEKKSTRQTPLGHTPENCLLLNEQPIDINTNSKCSAQQSLPTLIQASD
ncbi:trehalase [Ordospora colligata]|uniref:Trehalase n=1 Tax=Ordospora colligata OC4 TaxID=1354746 RepID=A0A0B2UMX8_9MICR|nr:trehalase [Ordospora colligata OC4]KHN70295.1 trehalase [Ordospora colligata OC4]TBU16839.1 trehalase [Ordospora colligata]TBU16947.1 trehalase [Ordospora colligata]TBU19388.1 trehalase [Ordospora colligata]